MSDPTSSPGPSPDDLLAYLDASPSPYHAVAEAAGRLRAAGFEAVEHERAWPASAAARGMVARGGSLVAWAAPPAAAPDLPFRLVGAHTDSPNLRIRPLPDTGRLGWRQLGVEVYGGALLNSWLDRDLGLSGRVALRDGTERLVLVDRPVLRIPQLAIHLDRNVNEKGLVLNKQAHLTPVWGLGSPDRGAFARFLAAELQVEAEEIAAWEVMAHDLTPARITGADDEFVSSARLDDLCSAWSGLQALLAAADGDGPTDHVAVLVLFDHEEVGSTTATGADGALLGHTLERLHGLRAGFDRDAFLRALGGSLCVSADMAHAVHPNYPDRSEPDHPVVLNGGPVLKVNANARYATDAPTAAAFVAACDRAGVPVQRFVSRGDLPCGSTIGPVTAGRLGVPTVDVGLAQLAMHSARELCGSADPAFFARALAAFLG